MYRLIIALLAVTTAVQGYDIFADRCWEVGGEALFWRPCGESYNYGADTGNNNTITDLSLRPSYDVGFRIWGATYTTDCCHLFDIDWTHLRTFDSQRQASANLTIFPINQLGSGLANAHLKFAYDKVEFRAGRYVACYCNSMAWVYGGTGYLNIQRDQTVVAVNTAGTAQAKSVERAGFEGGLLEVGVGADVEEPYCFHLLGRIGALVGIGERTLHQTRTVTGTETTYVHPGQTSCIAGVQMRLGVQWRYQCGCVWIMPQVSYQLDHYFDALRLSRLARFDPITQTDLHSVGFSGPSVSLAIRF